MQAAKCHCHLFQGGSVPKPLVTPAQVAFLRSQFHHHVGADPVTNLVVISETLCNTKTVQVETKKKQKDGTFETVLVDKQVPDSTRPWTDAQEIARLRQTYGYAPGTKDYKIDKLYPGVNPKLPQTFAEVEFKLPDAETQVSHGKILLPGEEDAGMHTEGLPKDDGNVPVVVATATAHKGSEDDAEAPELPIDSAAELAMRG